MSTITLDFEEINKDNIDKYCCYTIKYNSVFLVRNVNTNENLTFAGTAIKISDLCNGNYTTVKWFIPIEIEETYSKWKKNNKNFKVKMTNCKTCRLKYKCITGGLK